MGNFSPILLSIARYEEENINNNGTFYKCDHHGGLMLLDLHHEGSNVGPRAMSAAPANHVQWYYPAGTPPSPFHHHQHHHHQPIPFYGYVHLWMDFV